jgi:hypothetical protein
MRDQELDRSWPRAFVAAAIGGLLGSSVYLLLGSPWLHGLTVGMGAGLVSVLVTRVIILSEARHVRRPSSQSTQTDRPGLAPEGSRP